MNDIPVFVKGSNLVPMDSFESRVTDDVVDDILESAVTANMNMVCPSMVIYFSSHHSIFIMLHLTNQ